MLGGGGVEPLGLRVELAAVVASDAQVSRGAHASAASGWRVVCSALAQVVDGVFAEPAAFLALELWQYVGVEEPVVQQSDEFAGLGEQLDGVFEDLDPVIGSRAPAPVPSRNDQSYPPCWPRRHGPRHGRRALSNITCCQDDSKRQQPTGTTGREEPRGCLIAMVTGDESGKRVVAAETLGKSGNSQAVEPLLILLRDGNPRVQAAAAKALGKLRNRRAVDGLLASLRSDQRFVRISAIGALGRIGDPKVVPPLQAALVDRGQIGWLLYLAG
jgi:hypothetical protein